MGAGLKGMGVFASGFLGILAWKREIDSVVSIWVLLIVNSYIERKIVMEQGKIKRK